MSRRSRRAAAAAAGLTLSMAVVPLASAATWRLSQPAPPTPPAGATPAPYPVPLGPIGDVQFFSPNRGLLATAGSGTAVSGTDGIVKEGLYRWDGRSWSPFSTVCSAPVNEGQFAPRVVWAGAQEFWTIAYPTVAARGNLQNLGWKTLCHFKDGAMVASYATPPTSSTPYREMTAGACSAPDNCWFGGGALDDRPGAFHLRWDGSELRIANGPQGRPILDMEAYRGAIYEVADVSPDASEAQLSTPEEVPLLIHKITLDDGLPTFAADPFVAGDYPDGADPNEIDDETGDYFPEVVDDNKLNALDSSADVLWAAGGQTFNGPGKDWLEDRFARGPVLAAKQLDGPFTEIPLTDERLDRRNLQIIDLAALPDRTAWLAMLDPTLGGAPVVAHVDLTGSVLDYAVLPLPDDPDPNTIGGQTGRPARIACTGVDACWLATSAGWLYRLGADDPSLLVDDSPYFTTFLSTRPDDATSVPDLSDAIPQDNSGADLPPQLPQFLTPVEEPTAVVEPAPQARNVKVKALGRSKIRITFRLTLRASVKVRLLHKKKVVAQSKRKVLKAGTKTYTFTVSPKRWPTDIKLDVAKP